MSNYPKLKFLEDLDDVEMDDYMNGFLMMAAATIGVDKFDLDGEIASVMDDKNLPEMSATNYVLHKYGLPAIEEIEAMIGNYRARITKKSKKG